MEELSELRFQRLGRGEEGDELREGKAGGGLSGRREAMVGGGEREGTETDGGDWDREGGLDGLDVEWGVDDGDG